MDKNYNVDDILAEIKRRKASEKASAQSAEMRPAAPPPPNPDAFEAGNLPEQAFAPPAETFVRERPARARPAPEAPVREAPSGEESGGFRFQLPEEKPPRPSNPMEFSGQAYSITDKAKMRQRPVPSQRLQQDFQFAPPADATPTAPPVQFVETPAAIGEPDGFSAAPEKPKERQFVPFRLKNREDVHTRVLPKIALGEEDEAEATVPEAAYEDSETRDTPPDGAVIDYSEYNSVSDRRDVQRDIAKVKLWLLVRTVSTLVLTIILTVFALGGKYNRIPLPEALWPIPETMRMYMIACVALTVLIAAVGSSTIGGGLIGLFRLRANSDSLAALAILAAIAQGVAGIAKPELVEPEAMNLYLPAAALAMLFNAAGKMLMIGRIQTNFRIIASDRPKKAFLAMESDEFCREFIKAPSRRRPTVGYSAEAGFFSDFLGLSYSDKYDVGINRAVAPVCLIGAVVVTVAVYVFSRSAMTALSSLAGILCVCAALSSTFIENVPLAKLTRKLAPQGGLVSGNKAVEDFCDTKAIILSENDLFPQGNVRLQGIKAFAQGRVDEAILDAASVLCAIDGALGPVFLETVGSNRKLLKKVDNIVFENAMGLSAWVDSRRVLIGNRQLMLNHGITMPPEAQRQPEGGDPLYLANSGEVSAQFTVSYHIDEVLAASLDRLAVKNTLLIVHTNDANITPKKLWELYGYPEENIRILPAEWHPRLREMTAPREKAIAEIVYTGKASVLVSAILMCMAARSSILSATVVQLAQVVLGYGIVAFLAFTGRIGTVSFLMLAAYQLGWFLIIWIVQQVRQA